MRKRTSTDGADSPGPSKRKRIKVDQPAQPRIEHFFSSDRARAGPNTTNPRSNSTRTSRSNIQIVASSSTVPEIIDVDSLGDFDNPITSTFKKSGSEGLATPPQFESSHDTVTGICSSDAALGGSTSESSNAEDTPESPSKFSFMRPASAHPTFSRLSVDPAAYIPNLQTWPSGPTRFSFLVHTLATLTQTRSRITIINSLTNALRTIILHDPNSLLSALYLLSNTLSPPYSPIELGLGPSIISNSIQQVSGLSAAALKGLYNVMGDPGDVAFAAKSNLRTLLPHPPLLATSVYDMLLKIARLKGPGAAKSKQKIVEKLLVAAVGEETRFLCRILVRNLRVGAVRTSILTALARAIALTPPPQSTNTSPVSSYHIPSQLLLEVKPLEKSKTQKSDSAREQLMVKFNEAESLVKRVFVKHPDYDHIVAALLEDGLDGLETRVQLTIGIPLHPTLGSPTRSMQEIYDRLGDQPFSAEFKYDGQRAQIHGSLQGNGVVVVKIFSRHLEDMTSKYPDVVSLVKSIFAAAPETKSLIMDSEIVAIDPDGNLKSFQELSNRARKDVQLDDVQITVCVYAFDLMYIDGEALLARTFRERRKILRTRFPPLKPEGKAVARFDHVESCESDQGVEGIAEFWERAVGSRCEGLMIKLLDTGETTEVSEGKKGKSRKKPLPATYEPDKRTSAWLKLKKDYIHGLGDSLDLVPIGAWHGNGRKAQWWSPILLALWDQDLGQFVAVCKCMSGFTDAFYKELRQRYQLAEGSTTCSSESLWEVETGGLRPEVYFKPQEVWEIRGADITLSPVSVAARGLVSPDRGLSLRFPRFIRERQDKSVNQASSPQFLANMWDTQEANAPNKGGNDEGDLLDIEFDEDHEDEDEPSSEGD